MPVSDNCIGVRDILVPGANVLHNVGVKRKTAEEGERHRGVRNLNDNIPRRIITFYTIFLITNYVYNY